MTMTALEQIAAEGTKGLTIFYRSYYRNGSPNGFCSTCRCLNKA